MSGFFSKYTPLQLATAELQDEKRSILGDFSRMELSRSSADHHIAKIARLKAYIEENTKPRVEGDPMPECKAAIKFARAELAESEVQVMRHQSDSEKHQCMVEFRQRKIKRLTYQVYGAAEYDLPMDSTEVFRAPEVALPNSRVPGIVLWPKKA